VDVEQLLKGVGLSECYSDIIRTLQYAGWTTNISISEPLLKYLRETDVSKDGKVKKVESYLTEHGQLLWHNLPAEDGPHGRLCWGTSRD